MLWEYRSESARRLLAHANFAISTHPHRLTSDVPAMTKNTVLLHQDISESLTEYDLDDILEAILQLHDAGEILRLMRDRGIEL